MAIKVCSGSFTAVGPAALADSGAFLKDFNVTIWGTFTGTIRPERSFDGGVTWVPYVYIDGSALTWSSPASTALFEPENGVLWRLNCTSLQNGGTVYWRISQ